MFVPYETAIFSRERREADNCGSGILYWGRWFGLEFGPSEWHGVSRPVSEVADLGHNGRCTSFLLASDRVCAVASWALDLFPIAGTRSGATLLVLSAGTDKK